MSFTRRAWLIIGIVLFVNSAWLIQSIYKEVYSPSLFSKVERALYEHASAASSHARDSINNEPKIWPSSGIKVHENRDFVDELASVTKTQFPEIYPLAPKRLDALKEHYVWVQQDILRRIISGYYIDPYQKSHNSKERLPSHYIGRVQHFLKKEGKQLLYLISQQKEGYRVFFASTSDVSVKFQFLKGIALPLFVFFATVLTLAGLSFKGVVDVEKSKTANRQLKDLIDSYSRFIPKSFFTLLNKKQITDVEIGDHQPFPLEKHEAISP